MKTNLFLIALFFILYGGGSIAYAQTWSYASSTTTLYPSGGSNNKVCIGFGGMYNTGTDKLTVQGGIKLISGNLTLSSSSQPGIGYEYAGGYLSAFRMGGFGTQSLFLGTTGYSSNSDRNTFVGTEAGQAETGSTANTFVGYRSGKSNTTGGYNVFLGSNAGNANTTGSNNVCIGKDAGSVSGTNSNNVFIGAGSGAVGTCANSTAIGYGATVNNATDAIVLGSANARVGIGINSPDVAYKLDVCGKIRAKEIRVQTGWCDFVFAKDYRLMPLPQLAQYIEQNKHLPNIPPASTVETEGIELADMTARIMQKVEELTLYVIEQQKQIEELKQQNTQLQGQIDAQQKQKGGE